MNIEPQPKTDKDRIRIMENRIEGLEHEVEWLKHELAKAFDKMQTHDIPVWAQIGQEVNRKAEIRMICRTVIFLVCVLAVTAQADVITFKNGTSIEGEVIEMTPERVVIKTKAGNIFNFTQDEIEKIKIDDPIIPGPERDALLAAALSGIIPGAGQTFNEQYDKAIVGLAAWGAGLYYAFTAFEPHPDGTGVYIPYDNVPRFGLGVLLAYGTAIISVVDAAIVRTQINQRRQERRKRLNINASLDPPVFRATYGIRF